MRKYIPYIILSLFTIVIVVCIICVRISDRNTYLISYKKNYNITSNSNDDDYININLFINNKKSYILDKNQLNKCYLSDRSNSSILNIEIDSIKKTELDFEYKNSKYYCYNFRFKIMFDTDDEFEWYINEAILNLRYKGDKEYNINIGDINYIKVDNNNNDIIISNIKPLLSSINDNSYMTGLIVGVRKNSNYNVNIAEINFMNCNIAIGDKIQIIDKLPNGNDFKTICGYDNSSVVKGDGLIDLNLNSNDRYFIVIPIYYDELLIVNECVIKFKINVNGEEKSFYLKDYTFYQPNNEIIEKNNIYIYDQI